MGPRADLDGSGKSRLYRDSHLHEVSQTIILNIYSHSEIRRYQIISLALKMPSKRAKLR